MNYISNTANECSLKLTCGVHR